MSHFKEYENRGISVDPGALVAFNNYVLVSYRSGDVHVIDIGLVPPPYVEGWVATLEAGFGNKITMYGDYALLTGKSIQVIDVSQPDAPRLIGSLAMPEEKIGSTSVPKQVSGVAIYGHHAVVAAGMLLVIDMSTPARPKLVASLEIEGSARDIAMQGDLVLVAGGGALEGSLRVIDLSSVTSPVLVGSVATPSYARRVVAYKDYSLVITGDDRSLQVIDISSRSEPNIVRDIDIKVDDFTATPRDMVLYGDYLLIAICCSALSIVDMSEPEAPQIIGHVELELDMTDIAVLGHYALMLDNYDGLQIVDLSIPSAPRIKDVISLPRGSQAIATQEERAYIVGETGFRVLRPFDCYELN